MKGTTIINPEPRIPRIPRRTFLGVLSIGVISGALQACNNVLESGESRELTPGTHVHIKDIVSASQDNRLQIILLQAYTDKDFGFRRGSYLVQVGGDNQKKSITIESIVSNGKTIRLTYTEDGYLYNDSRSSISLGKDLGEILLSIEANVPPSK